MTTNPEPMTPESALWKMLVTERQRADYASRWGQQEERSIHQYAAHTVVYAIGIGRGLDPRDSSEDGDTDAYEQWLALWEEADEQYTAYREAMA